MALELCMSALAQAAPGAISGGKQLAGSFSAEKEALRALRERIVRLRRFCEHARCIGIDRGIVDSLQELMKTAKSERDQAQNAIEAGQRIRLPKTTGMTSLAKEIDNHMAKLMDDEPTLKDYVKAQELHIGDWVAIKRGSEDDTSTGQIIRLDESNEAENPFICKVRLADRTVDWHKREEVAVLRLASGGRKSRSPSTPRTPQTDRTSLGSYSPGTDSTESTEMSLRVGAPDTVFPAPSLEAQELVFGPVLGPEFPCPAPVLHPFRSRCFLIACFLVVFCIANLAVSPADTCTIAHGDYVHCPDWASETRANCSFLAMACSHSEEWPGCNWFRRQQSFRALLRDIKMDLETIAAISSTNKSLLLPDIDTLRYDTSNHLELIEKMQGQGKLRQHIERVSQIRLLWKKITQETESILSGEEHVFRLLHRPEFVHAMDMLKPAQMRPTVESITVSHEQMSHKMEVVYKHVCDVALDLDVIRVSVREEKEAATEAQASQRARSANHEHYRQVSSTFAALSFFAAACLSVMVVILFAKGDKEATRSVLIFAVLSLATGAGFVYWSEWLNTQAKDCDADAASQADLEHQLDRFQKALNGTMDTLKKREGFFKNIVEHFWDVHEKIDTAAKHLRLGDKVSFKLDAVAGIASAMKDMWKRIQVPSRRIEMPDDHPEL